MQVQVGEKVRVQGHSRTFDGVIAKVHGKTVTLIARGGGKVRGVKVADLRPDGWHFGDPA